MRIATLLLTLPLVISAQDPREIIRKAIDLDDKNAIPSRNYTFVQREEAREYDSSGKLTKHTVRTVDVTLQNGSPYRRIVSRDDHTLTAAEQRDEEQKLQRSVDERSKETVEERQRRIAEWHRKEEKRREPLREVPEAFNFRLLGTEGLSTGDAWVIDAMPKPGYQPKSSMSSFLPKVKARFWIDRKDGQFVKLEMETLDSVWLAGFLVRLGKGCRVTMEHTRVNDEVWLPKRIDLKGTARVLLLKVYRGEMLWTFSDYRKFQVDSHLLTIGQAGPGK